MAKSLIYKVAFANASSEKIKTQPSIAKSLIYKVAFRMQLVARNLMQLVAVAVPCIGGTQRNLVSAT